MAPHRYAVIVAGGRGLRMGAELPKQFLPLRGEPVLMHTLRQFAPEVEELILVLPADQQGLWQELCTQHQFTLLHRIADGGATRFESVRSGLSKLPEQGLVAIHDGAPLGITCAHSPHLRGRRDEWRSPACLSRDRQPASPRRRGSERSRRACTLPCRTDPTDL